MTDDYPLWHPMTDMGRYLSSPVTITEGRGSRLVDQNGREYVSANAALWNMHCGFDEPRIQAAIRAQLDRLSYGTLFRYGNEPAQLLASRLVEISPRPELTKVFYNTSGAGAVDTALKLARRYQRLIGRPERDTVAALADSYHGTLDSAMAVTGEDLEQDEYGVDRSAVMHVPTPLDERGAADALERLRAAAGRLAAVIVEPVLGSAGVLVPHEHFFSGLNDLCEANDICLIVDEVATGFGRTGSMFAAEWTGLRPDLLVMSKGINGGFLPMSAVLIHQRVWEAFAAGGAVLRTGETQAGNPLACAAALATLDVIEADDLVSRSLRSGERLTAMLTDALPRARGQALAPTGRGLMLGVGLQGPGGTVDVAQAAVVVERFRSLGVIVHLSDRGFSLMPPLIIDDDDVKLIADAAGQVFDELDLS
ncbi:aminotransferase class III-fold pyridoxal phosphate-dependent enzyme [Glycomyces sp. TRM65418]|uniref:aminotransferase family protein n=1 Tax=Glycomyces sp. TRM65418 TaxID=2867006 RepID=UPI001CE4D1F0|nr:aminotransferase class III-fold pyridoxal phosphate-dependent enzyme [Glycomyces sp. TRM65418]MCC3765518.1 aminotransferase class III-fold pyridoxal phosphate-dependent enzyme [Glycomyces sp. TRM65418]QZD55125.1 aminotransferase class III-fold pyridoxal phosphate-dependent enzyme [Glycomyces sp. TRM65418]